MPGRIPEDIQEYNFDLIIVGAGINGAGIARDATMRGLKVLLLDKGDISSGTSSWSSRLIHGGLRYLEYYEVRLVRESLSDREKLLRVAPHLVKPVPFVIPIYGHNKRGPGMVRLGMLAFDLLSFDKSMASHKMIGRDEALKMVPGLNPEGLKGAALYYDCQVEYAERLVLENAVSARDHGAIVLNYAEVERLVLENGTVRGVEFADVLENGRKYTAHAPVTVNVSGPWVDEVLAGLRPAGANPNAGRFMGGTKGTHLVVDPFPGGSKEVLYYEALSDNRPILVIPWNGRYLIGTTDLRYEGDLDLVVGDEGEIEYLLQETNALIPEANLTRDDVLYTYSGVRPLPYNPEGEAGGVTRSHVVFDHAEGQSAAGGKVKNASLQMPQVGGLISIIGGKLTTYRNLSRQTTDAVYKKLGTKPPKSATDRVPLPGGAVRDFDAFAAEFKAKSGLRGVLASRLLEVYGARAYDVLAEAGGDPALKKPLAFRADAETGIIGAEVLYALRREMAQTLSDVLLRRSMVAYGPKVGLDVDRAAAAVAIKHLGWTEERAEREVAEYRRYIERYTPRTLIEA
jgi:glycerol-3-phosphate dehydrogenase